MTHSSLAKNSVSTVRYRKVGHPNYYQTNAYQMPKNNANISQNFCKNAIRDALQDHSLIKESNIKSSI